MSEEDNVPEVSWKNVTSKKRSRKQDTMHSKHLSKKVKYKNMPKMPTIEEVKQLNTAETMYHSSMFRLQIDELMAEVKRKMKFKTELQAWLESLKSALKNIPQSDRFELNDLSWIKKKVKIPLIQPVKHRKGYFCFLPPAEICEVGSFVLDTLCAAEPVVDVALKLPKAFWQKTDYLNQVYHRKRAMYLVYIAQALNKHLLIEDIKFNYHNNCHLRPVLLLKPKGILAPHFFVRLLPYPEEDCFKLSRFVPEQNNVRKSWFYEEAETIHDTTIPTPIYNSTLLQDILIPRLAAFLKETISSQSLKNGIVLLKVWCIQRDIYGCSEVMNGFIISMIVAYLLLKKIINPLMSSYQIFRNTLLALKRNDWTQLGITLCQENALNQPPIEQFHKLFDVVFVEVSGFLNICHAWSKAFYQRLQHEADLALTVLDSSHRDSFAVLFISKVPFYRKFEFIFSLISSSKLEEYCHHLKAEDSVLDHSGDYMAVIVSRINQILNEGVGKRVLILCNKVDSFSSWSVHQSPPNPNSRSAVFGILQNEEYAHNNLEKGPSADSIDANKFRSFWGEKSELRRFKDGSIHEAVLWPADTYEKRRCVLPEIIKYVLQRHVGIMAEDLTFCGSDIDVALQMPTLLDVKGLPTYATGEEHFTTLMQSFNSLAAQLRKLDDLPLMISAVQGISPSFRFAEVFPPIPKVHVINEEVCGIQNNFAILREDSEKAPEWIHPLDVIVHLEGSGKWPDDIEALKRVKAAFHLKIGELLHKQFYLCTKPGPSFVDVMKDGFVYRLHIACHKEITLLNRVEASDGVMTVKENNESRDLELQTEILPKLNGILYGLQQQHNTFGIACRFAKRWVSSQLLHDEFHDVAIELIMASVYIHPEPFTCPRSPQVAFQRFLALLCTNDWETIPLIVNFHKELEKQEISDILSTVTSQRSVLPPMIIVTPLDKTGTLWTRKAPSLMILSRLISLANVALETLEKQLMDHQASDFKLIFRAPLDPYDVVIHLKPKQVSKLCYSVDNPKWFKMSPLHTYRKEENEKMPIIGYDPVQCYLKNLRECFGEFALFFYDTYGGTFIAVVWKPDAFKKKPFKVSHINSRMVSDGNVDGTLTIVPNVEEILQNFRKLGVGLVKKIEKHFNKWIIP